MRNFKFNELDQATKIYNEGLTGEKVNYSQVYLLAKYLRVKLGYGRTRIEKTLIAYCNKLLNDFFNEVTEREMIDNIVRTAMKAKKIENSCPVIITKNELDKINMIEDFETKKIMFVMLVLAKAMKNRKQYDSEKLFIDDIYHTQIRSLAGVRASHSKFHRVFLHSLLKLDYVYAFLRHEPQISMQIGILIYDEQSEPAITITDFDNIVSYLPIICPRCKKVIEKKPKRRNECNECYKEIRREKVRQNVARFRASE